MEFSIFYIVLAAFFGLFMMIGVGANDLANVLSTAMGSKAMNVRTAIIIAIIFEFAGALLGGTAVTNTIRTGIVDINFVFSPSIFIHGMLATMVAGSLWMAIATYWGMPVSITHTIVGSVLGFGLLIVGSHAVHWIQIGYIATSWIISPVIAGIAAYLLFESVQRSILRTPTPLENARRYVPIYLFLVGLVLASITVIKGLRHLGVTLTVSNEILIAVGAGVIILLFGMMLLRRIDGRKAESFREQFAVVEGMFGLLMIFTACAMVFAHGSNDVAIAMGPLVGILGLIHHENVGHGGTLVYTTLAFGCSGVVIGLLIYGQKVIRTVGRGITALTPSRAFCATIAAATTVIVSTSLGIPVSTTTTLVGGVLGVGMARGIGALDLRVIRRIFMSWVVTVPVGAIITMIAFYILQLLC